MLALKTQLPTCACEDFDNTTPSLLHDSNEQAAQGICSTISPDINFRVFQVD